MTERKKRSVDFLIEELHNKGWGNYTVDVSNELREKARAMHRDEIQKAYNDGLGNGIHYERGEANECVLDEKKYYNENFNTESK